MMKTPTLLVAILLFFSTSAMSDEKTPTSNLPLPDTWTIESAVRFALSNSPDTQIAQQRIAAAKANIGVAQSANFPRIGVHSSYGQTTNPMYSFGNILNQEAFSEDIDFNNPGRTDNFNVTTDITYRLYNGGADQATIKAAAFAEKATKSILHSTQNDLAFQVIRTFYLVNLARQQKTAHEAELAAINASLDVANARYESGGMLREDVLNLEVQKARVLENIIKSRHTVELSERSFLNLLGLKNGSTQIEINNLMLSDPALFTIEKRSELVTLSHQIDATEEQVKKIQSGYLPTVDGFASYQYDKGFELDGAGTSWTAGVKVDFMLYEGSRTKSHIAAVKAKLSELKRQKHKIELSLDLDMKKARLEFEQAKERKVVTQKLVEVAEESARLNRLRFQQGLILSSDLVDIETRLTDAHVRQAAAHTNYNVAIANLQRAAGLLPSLFIQGE